MSGSVNSYVLELKTRGLRVVEKGFKGLTSNVKKSSSVLNKFKGVLLGVGAAFGTAEIIKYTQDWQQMTNMLRIVTSDQEHLLYTRQRLIASSREVRQDLSATTRLYQRLAIQQSNLGASQEELIDFTKATSMALSITGASAAEARSVLLQLGQAMGTAAVNGDEFRSIAEGAPRIIKAVADSLGVQVGDVKRLTRAGKLLSKDFFDAVLDQMPKVRAEFEQTDITLSQAGTILTNSLKVAVGLFGEMTGAALGASKIITKIGDMIHKWTYDLTAAVIVLNKIFSGKMELAGGGTKGFIAAFKEAATLAGQAFMSVISKGFPVMESTFEWLGYVMASGFTNHIVKFLPKVAQRAIAKPILDALTTQEFKNIFEDVGWQDKNTATRAAKQEYESKQTPFMQRTFTRTRKEASPFEDLPKREQYQRIYTELNKIDAVNASVLVKQRAGTEASLLQEQAAKDLATMWTTAGPQIKDEFKELLEAYTGVPFDEISNDIKTTLDEILNPKASPEEAAAPFVGFFDRIGEAVGGLKEKMADFNFMDLATGAKEAGEAMATSFTDGVKTTGESLINLAFGLDDVILDLDGLANDFKTGLPKGIALGFKEANESAKAFDAQIQKITVSLIEDMSGALTDVLTGGEADFKSLAKTAVDSLIEVMIQAAITETALSLLELTGQTTGFIGSMLSALSGAQFGGSTQPNTPIRVGEAREEVFVPSTAGRVANYQQGASEGKQQPITMINVVPDALTEIGTPSGHKILMNFVKENKTAIASYVS